MFGAVAYDAMCPKCGSSDYELVEDYLLKCNDCGTEWKANLTYEDLYENSEEFMCDTCGNPDYPKCRDSCDRIDD